MVLSAITFLSVWIEKKQFALLRPKGITANCIAMLPQYGIANIGKTKQIKI